MQNLYYVVAIIFYIVAISFMLMLEYYIIKSIVTKNSKENDLGYGNKQRILKFLRLKPNAKVPTRGSLHSAGYDLYACLEESVVVKPNETVKIPTGFTLEMPNGYVGLIFARSGLATKKGLAPANKVGVCDSDYRGEYVVALKNSGSEEVVINSGDRVAQLVVMPVLNVKFSEVEVLSETGRGVGGFGSTGV